MLVSVVGASGAIGRSAVNALLDAGHGVRAVGRSREKLHRALGARITDVEVVTADVTAPAGCERAARDADAVVYTPGLSYRTKAFARYPEITRTMIEACSRSSTRAFVLVSNVYPYGVPRGDVVDESHPLAPAGQKGRFRKEQEDVVLDANVADRFETAVLRLPAFFGAHANNSNLSLAAAAIARHAPVPLLAPVDVPTEYVVPQDVGPVIARLLDRRGWGGRPYNMAGTGLSTQRQLVHLLMQAAGVDLPLRVLPVWARRALGLVVPLLGELREIDYLLSTTFVLAETRLSETLGGAITHTPFRLAAERWIAALAPSATARDTSSARRADRGRYWRASTGK